MRKTKFNLILASEFAGEPAYLQRTVEGKTYTRKFSPPERLIILGGGHIAQNLCRIAAMLDFSVVGVDDRPSFANTALFPYAEKSHLRQFSKRNKED